MVFRDRQNPLEVYNDEEYVQRFRFDRQTIADIYLIYKFKIGCDFS